MAAQGQPANSENNSIGVSGAPTPRKRGRPAGSGRGRRNTGQGMATGTNSGAQAIGQPSGLYIKGRVNLQAMTGQQGWDLRHLLSLGGIDVTS